MTGQDSHTGFIVAAYAVAAIVILTMVLATVIDYRSLKRRLGAFGPRGLDRE